MSDNIYPIEPGFKASGASQEAAEAISGVASNLRNQVLQIIAARPNGVTADEIAVELNRSVLCIRPRVSELRRLAQIRQAEGRGRNQSGMSASKWIIALPPEAPADKAETRT